MTTYVSGLKTSIQLAGTWTDISAYVHDRAAPSSATTTGGRPDETAQIAPTIISGQVNNRDARFTARNPTGPYYPNFGRNTPVRLSVPYGTVYLRMEDDQVSSASTPDAAGLHVTGDIDLRIDVQLSDYRPADLVSKWTAFEQAWMLQLNGDGTLTFSWSTTGTNTVSAQSTSPVPLGRIVLRVTMQASTGNVTFYTAAAGNASSGPFTQLGNVAGGAGSTSVFAATSAIFAGPANGAYFEFQLRNGIGGSVVADPVFTAQTAGATSFTDFESNTWTVNGTAELTGQAYIAHAQMSELPVSWDPSGRDIYVPFQAGGLLRRLSQGNSPVQSAMRRAVGQQGNLVAYWPCEDMAQSNQLAAAVVAGGFPMYVNQGTLTFASSTVLACSGALPVTNGAITSALVTPYTPAASTSVRFLLSVPAGGDQTFSAPMAAYVTGTLGNAVVFYGKGIGLTLAAGGTFETATPIPVDGIPCLVSVELTTSGSNTTCTLNVLYAGSSTAQTQSVTATSTTIGTVRSVRMNANAGLTQSAFGHVFAQSPLTAVTTLASPLAAWAGETAGNRVTRLCTENNVATRVYGYPAESVVMGQQTIDTLPNLLQSCEDADRGLLYEPATCLGIGYRTLRSMTGQSPVLTLDYSKAQAGDQENNPVSLTSVDDDQYTVNDWTVTRNNGSSYEAILNDGTAMATGTIGAYQNSKNLILATDSQLPDAAGWLLHVSTANDERYPQVRVALHNPAIITAALAAPVLGVKIGDLIQITNPPAWLPPGPLQLIVAGVAHSLTGWLHQVSWNCVPAAPYLSALFYDSGTHFDTDGSTLHTTITSGATSMSVTTTGASPPSPLWTTAGGDFPFNVIMDGEVVTVTNITGGSSPQTFTIARSVNGVVKAHTAGVAVNVYPPPVWALT